MSQDLTGYTRSYYRRDLPETWFARQGLLRPDQLAAVCYAYAVPFWGTEPFTQRDPGLTVSVGCGTGTLEQHLERLGVDVIGCDPSPGARELYQGKTLVDRVTDEMLSAARTVIFCESIEHVPLDTTLAIRARLQPGSRLVVVNWPDYHPIRPDRSGWDHITDVDDDLFDRLSEGADVAVRRGSHLVLDVTG